MSFNEIQRQDVQLSALEKYELLRVLSADLKSLSKEELEPIQAAKAAKKTRGYSHWKNPLGRWK
jgi:hypothetical protein